MEKGMNTTQRTSLSRSCLAAAALTFMLGSVALYNAQVAFLPMSMAAFALTAAGFYCHAGNKNP